MSSNDDGNPVVEDEEWDSGETKREKVWVKIREPATQPHSSCQADLDQHNPSVSFGSHAQSECHDLGVPLGCPLLDELQHRHFVDGDVHVVELEVTDELRGPGGAVHGGVVASLVDCAGAAAVARASGRLVATLSLSINYLAAGRVGPLQAKAMTLRVGQHHGVAEVNVYDLGREYRLVASALITLTFLAGDRFASKPDDPEGRLTL